jgi:glucosamine-6-phosphate deaminase
MITKIITKNYWEMGSSVADIVEHTLTLPEPKLILPTGSTPISLYKELVNRDLDWSTTTTFNLDEYIDNTIQDQSYRYFMMENLFKHTNMDDANIYFPGDIAVWPDLSYGTEVDLCLLGIGGNGHIAFNEPGSSFDSETRMVDLTEETIKDNSRFFPTIDDVPTQAVTIGLKSIMSSKKIVLMANGVHKLNILNVAMNGEVTEDVPASILQKHKNVEVFYCD